MPELSDAFVKKAFATVFILWIFVNIALIAHFWGAPQSSDPKTYMNIAARCFRAGEWYPNASAVYSPYIWNPAFINFLILQLKLFGTNDYNAVFNFIMNIGIVLEIFYLGRKYFSERVGFLACTLYCLTYSNAFVTLSAGTEIPFLFLMLGGFCLCHSRKLALLAAAGIILALANWTRPFLLIFAPSIIGLFIFEKRNVLNYAAVIIPYVLLTLIIGKCAYDRTGHFITQTTTSPINLIMTANDSAYGGVATSIFSDKNNIAYIENGEKLTFDERGKIWMERAVSWIKRNPGRYCALYVKKLFGLYAEDSWAERPILGNSAFIDAYFVQKNIPTSQFVAQLAIMALKSLTYYLAMLLFLYWIFANWRELFSKKILLFSVIVLGTALTCIFCVSSRYHYPMFFAIAIFAGAGLNGLISPNKQSAKK